MTLDVRISFDKEADAAYLTLSDAAVAETDEVADGIHIDYDAAKRPVGIEVLSVRRRLGGGDLDSYLRGLAEGLLASSRQAAE
ncbi:MAG TPA: DUF2283 domain-containing protein [Beijerinckiaceae bacterium]|jgi:uncharacterized protein YuzE